MFKIYWTDKEELTQGQFSADLNTALRLTEQLRKEGNSFVTMVSENPNSVGKPGVDTIKDGLCPDGVAYSWVKRRLPA